MTPTAFIAKWRANARNERAAAQEHFLDLCALLDEPTPNSDPTGAAYAFEKGATKASGGEGWADVWRRGRFAWEYKGKHKDLDAAHRQLLQYAGALENPPLLVTSDIERITIRTNWTNAVSERHEVRLEEMADPVRLGVLKSVFADPERLRPGTTRAALTAKAAADFAELAGRLRSRGNDPQGVAHFVNRLVFCLFADDVGLLPAGLFERMLDAARKRPAQFQGYASRLFAAMAERGGEVDFTPVAWFNGGLFDDGAALPLEADDIGLLQRAAALDWAEVDPSILGTLFERGLDPDKRSQLGAHYTSREMIERLIEPVVRLPLLAEWGEVREQIAAALTAGIASSEHWKTGRDFLDFWQAVRSGFQTSPVPYTFLIVGTNPSAVERVKLFESDNPLFGNVEKRFMPMFDEAQISEMVLDLGKIMGVEFNSASLNRLSEDFGGHPFLTRYACSHIANQIKNRPLMIDRTVYAMGVNKFKTESHEYVRSVVGLLEENYPEEYEMLKYLASDLTSFNVMAKSYPSVVEHLIGYGIVGNGEISHFFRIGIVEGFFEQEARPTQSLSFESRRIEISNGRNRIEQDLRFTIKTVFEISFSKKNRSGELLKAVPTERKEKLQQMPFDVLLSQAESPLFLLDLKSIIDKNWAIFENLLGITKSEFIYHVETVNKYRSDAHAKDISNDDFDKARVSLRELARMGRH